MIEVEEFEQIVFRFVLTTEEKEFNSNVGKYQIEFNHSFQQIKKKRNQISHICQQ